MQNQPRNLPNMSHNSLQISSKHTPKSSLKPTKNIPDKSKNQRLFLGGGVVGNNSTSGLFSVILFDELRFSKFSLRTKNLNILHLLILRKKTL